GSAIASVCDITVAHDTARFKLPEMEKDLPPTLAMSALVPKVSRRAIAWMVYSMAELDAAAAQQIGIVSTVAPSGQVEGAVAKLLGTMPARTPEALVAVRDFLRSAPHMEPRGMADYGANLLAAVLSSAGKWAAGGLICRGPGTFNGLPQRGRTRAPTSWPAQGYRWPRCRSGR